MTRICIIIPIHNESREIGRLIENIRAKALDIVVIDDGSTDSSGTIAREKGAVVLANPSRLGKGRSLKRGFEYALQHGYDGVITMDGDGQHDPEDLGFFLEKIREQPKSVITGCRMENAKGMPAVRFLTNLCMSGVISQICRRRIPDTQCGFRYIHGEILKNTRLLSNDFEIETEVLIKACRQGYPVFSLPVKAIYRSEHSKINPFKDTVRFLIYIFREIRSKENHP